MERQINAISYFYSKTQQEILEEAFESYWQECFRKNGDELKILMKLNQKNLREKNLNSKSNTDTSKIKITSKKLEEGIIKQVKQLTEINNKFENTNIKNIYQNIKNDESV